MKLRDTQKEAIPPVSFRIPKSPRNVKGWETPRVARDSPRPHLISSGDWSILAREGISHLTNSAPCQPSACKTSTTASGTSRSLHPAGVLSENPIRWQASGSPTGDRKPTTSGKTNYQWQQRNLPSPCWSPSKTPNADGSVPLLPRWFPSKSPPASNGF